MSRRLLPTLLACALCAALPAPLPACAGAPPRVMLPMRWQPGLDVRAYWVSEKLDGVRGRWDGIRLLTRGGETIDAPGWFTAGWPREPLDGELWIGRGRFEEVSDLVRGLRGGDAAWRQVRFMVYDLPADPAAFDRRVARMRGLAAAARSASLRVVPQFRVDSEAGLDARLHAVVAAGGEGLVLHHQAARYVAGRSTDLLKYKPFDDAEARVLGYAPGHGKYAGQLGALLVERPDGMRFRIGSGLSDAERAHPPPRGSWVTYRYEGTTAKGTPRFARFLRVRHQMPPPDPR
ncbi:MAG: DNA ligase [Lysobacteraceae bacterium]